MLTRVFIVGCPRSGTTLLQSLLAAHPKVLSFPETHFWTSLVPSRGVRRYLGLPSKGALEKFETIRNMAGISSSGMKPKLVSAWNRRLLARDFVRLIDSWAAARDCTHWIEKTPGHLHFIPQIDRDVPGARYLHIIRNGTDTVASLYEATHRYPEGWGGERTVEKCVNRWCADVERSLVMNERARHRLIRYEELTCDPERVINDCCRYLGLDFDPVQLVRCQEQADILVDPKEHWKEKNRSGLFSVSNGKKFEAVFSSEQQEYVKRETEKCQELLNEI